MDPVRPLIHPFGAPSPLVGKVGRSAVKTFPPQGGRWRRSRRMRGSRTWFAAPRAKGRPPSHPPKPMYFSMMSKGTRVPVALHTLWKP